MSSGAQAAGGSRHPIAYPDYASVEEIEADIAFAGYLLLRYGDYVQPVFERLERERDAMVQKGAGVRERARLAMERYALPVEPVKAIL